MHNKFMRVKITIENDIKRQNAQRNMYINCTKMMQYVNTSIPLKEEM